MRFACLCRQRALLAGAGGLALLAIALVLTPLAPAQSKKKEAAEKKAEAKTEKKWEKVEAKAEPRKVPSPEELEKAIAARPIDVVDQKNVGVEQVYYINEAIEKGWRDNKVKPSPRCSDYEFCRRAYLDIVGRIPTTTEIRTFLKGAPERRRSELINRLVDSNECAENFATIWTVMLLTRSGSDKVHQEQMREWLAEQFGSKEKKDESPGKKKGETKKDDTLTAKDEAPTKKEESPRKDDQAKSTEPNWARTVHDILTASGKTNKNGAVNYVLHHVGEEFKQDQRSNGKWDMVPVTSRTTRLFLGIRTQCVQCHDHPFNGEWKQEHFWGINAFFRQVKTSGRPEMMMKQKNKKDAVAQQYEVEDDPNLNAEGLVSYERRNGVLLYTDPTFLDGTKMEPKAKIRREELAKFVLQSPFLAKAFVNRMWGHFMGKSFTKDAVDDFGESNPVSHPELLDRLAEDFVKYDYNPKLLIRWICNSRAYGLSSVANPYNDKPEDETLFARMLLKPMTPEQLFESLMTATEAKVGQSKESRREKKEEWLDKLIVNFGNDEGEEGSFNGTVVQALLLMNGQDINKAVMDEKEGTVSDVIRRHAGKKDAARAAFVELYLAALGRPPLPESRPGARDGELDQLMTPRMYLYRQNTPPTGDERRFWIGYYQDVFWSLLNSGEFILNH